jgi:hypothetical protein
MYIYKLNYFISIFILETQLLRYTSTLFLIIYINKVLEKEELPKIISKSKYYKNTKSNKFENNKYYKCNKDYKHNKY